MKKPYLLYLPCTLQMLLYLFCNGIIKAQQSNFSTELKFSQFLFDKKLPDEAVFVLNRQMGSASFATLPLTQQDSLYYQLGWFLYSQKRLEESSFFLLKVSPHSSFFLKCQYFAGYNYAYLGNTDSATCIFDSINNEGDSILSELRNFELAGIALLKRSYPRYLQLKKSFTYGSYAFSREEKAFADSYQSAKKYPHKSAFVAGALSAIVPGAGKVYAGRTRQGIGAFLPVASLGLLTYEAWRKGGIKSARFIGFGSVFLIFYTANIWGSAVTVHVNAKDFNEKYDNKILFNMHIPLRNIFN